jgi:galactokinase
MRKFFAPGRVNIIGEHVDYNGGSVLPFAIGMGTTVVYTPRKDTQIVLTSENFPTSNDWQEYPRGIIHFLLHDTPPVGFELHFSGNIPTGAGLSSSASILLATATALNAVFSLGKSPLELVKTAQKSENEYNRVNCGIMDQFAIGMSKKDHAILLNCETLNYEHVPLNLGDYKFVIMNTNKRRSLNESKYNERREECKTHPKRIRHVTTENERVKKAANALKNGDLTALGELLNESHASLRDDFEVSCFELDTIVEAAQNHHACLGARMTGAGFGGCAIALVKQTEIPQFTKVVRERYENLTDYSPAFYECESASGACEI